MKRTLAALVTAILLLPALPRAAAAGASELWDSDRVLVANQTIVDLQVGPGVNISFEPPLNATPFWPVFLNISGGLEVCGTAERPSAFLASNQSLYIAGDIAGRLTIDGNGDPGQADVRNCSFQNLVVILNGTGGRFQDCAFYSCYVFVEDSTAAFTDCLFQRSAMSIYSPSSLNQTRLSGCRFDSLNLELWDPFWEYFEDVPAISVSGYAGIDNCTITGYGAGIESSSGLPVITGCLVTDCEYGITLDTTDPVDTPVVERCVIRDCTWGALYASGNLLMRDCILSGSLYCLILNDNGPGAGPNRTLSGNRISGNYTYGVSIRGKADSLGDTVFEDGNGIVNRLGRVVKWSDLMVNVSTRGPSTNGRIDVNLTDAAGGVHKGYQVNIASFSFPDNKEYVVDMSGVRHDYYPAVVRAEWGGALCETVVLAGTRNVTLYMTVLPDLVPVAISLDPPSPRAGDWLVISCLVDNTGTSQSPRTQALFTLDGERLDLSELYPVGANSSATVRATDWKARPGAHTVTVRLDPEHALDENDGSNNNLTFNFTVGEAPSRPVAAPDIVYPAAVVIVLVLSCAGGYLIIRRRQRAKGG